MFQIYFSKFSCESNLDDSRFTHQTLHLVKSSILAPMLALFVIPKTAIKSRIHVHHTRIRITEELRYDVMLGRKINITSISQIEILRINRLIF